MIPVFKPSYGKEEFEAVKKVMNSGWVGLGPKTQEFEEAFAKYIGAKYAVALNSCTAALHLAMLVMDIKSGDVLTTPMTFVSTNHAILYNNAMPIFCDSEPDTLNISFKEIEKNITKNTKAIVTVHYGGHACDMDPITKLAKSRGVKVIEDAAHGCGGEYKGRKIGTLGDIACFSFHAVKNLATGEGGMITTNDQKIYERLKKLRWLGINKGTWDREISEDDINVKKYSWYYDVEEVGFKCHLNDIPAAIGLVQLKKLDKMNDKRRNLSFRYNELLKGVGDIETPVVKSYAKSAHHNYAIKTEKRDGLNAYLQERGISTGVHYIPNHHYRMYKNCKADCPVVESVWKKLLTLPLYPDLTPKEQDMIVKHIKDFLK
ncbi:MAG: DegT/DnrJ/EryC1/StrS family aminotransferase [Candidatus Omnitrophota bacterium]|nr:DegT/DnrJ/EryC1/StrS family aminotransferase [Candidatus Omnitrophota bacterium]